MTDEQKDRNANIVLDAILFFVFFRCFATQKTQKIKRHKAHSRVCQEKTQFSQNLNKLHDFVGEARAKSVVSQ